MRNKPHYMFMPWSTGKVLERVATLGWGAGFAATSGSGRDSTDNALVLSPAPDFQTAR